MDFVKNLFGPTLPERPTTVDTSPITVQDVIISPGLMVFNNAYEGKAFKKLLTIQNVGKKGVVVRIRPPSAHAFEIDAVTRGYMISPGMKLVRTVRYTYRRVLEVLDALMSIYINDEEVQYKFMVFLTRAIMSVEPEEIDFGSVNTLSTIVYKTIKLKNTGCKNALYSIDLGKNETEISVKPLKGVVEAYSSVELKVEIMAFKSGAFSKEIWIKVDPPLSVKFTGEFFTPEFLTVYPKAFSDFSLVHFPRMYVGLRRTKTLIMKNFSSSNIMFCVMADIKNENMPYEIAHQTDDNFKCFHIDPTEGRVEAQESVIVQITFMPQYFFNNHAVGFINVMKVDCTDVTSPDFEPTFSEEDEREFETSSSQLVVASSMAEEDDELEEEFGSDIERKTAETTFDLDQSCKVCLYGDIEEPNLSLRPTAFDFAESIMNEVYVRELYVENLSKSLPITVKYCKIHFITVNPDVWTLDPSQSLEVVVRFKPETIGSYKGKITFDLLYPSMGGKRQMVCVGKKELGFRYSVSMGNQTKIIKKFNMGITPCITNEVGYLVEDVKFNTKIEMPTKAIVKKNPEVFKSFDADLVAFPNTTQKSLRPWRENTPCKTIFAKIPRCVVSRDEFNMTRAESEIRTNARQKMNDYIRSKSMKLGAPAKKTYSKDVYEQGLKDMFKMFPCETIDEFKKHLAITNFSLGDFIPLSPYHLYNIVLEPKYIKLEKIAPNTKVLESLLVKNNNDFPVYVHLVAVKPGVKFPHGTGKIINGKSEEFVYLSCATNKLGLFMNQIVIRINFTHLFKISIMVEVVPKSVKMDINQIVFNPDGNTMKFLQLKNKMNSSVYFKWELDFSRFVVEPLEGVLEKKKTLNCTIKYVARPKAPDRTELILISEDNSSQIIRVSRKKKPPLVNFNVKEIEFGAISLNIPTKKILTLRNFNDYDICFSVMNPTPLAGLEVEPIQGMIFAKADYAFTVIALRESVGFFKCKVDFKFDEEYPMQISITGNVIYPAITLKPPYITFRQVATSAYKRASFVVKNTSVCDCLIKFKLDDFPEFSVTDNETESKPSLEENVKLKPSEHKQFFLHIFPAQMMSISFILPIVLNDIIGPPVSNNAESLKPMYYLKNKKPSKMIPSKLPVIKVNCVVSSVVVTFSKLYFSFVHMRCINNTYKKFEIFNSGRDLLELCIRTDDLRIPFSLTYFDGIPPQIYPKSILCRLEAQEKSMFHINFSPVDFDEYFIQLPIYVKGHHDGCVFNHLTLHGQKIPPSIVTDKAIYYFEPMPVGVTSIIHMGIVMERHDRCCKLTYCNLPTEMNITFRRKEKHDSKETMTVDVAFSASKPCVNIDHVYFSCTCGTSVEVIFVANIENCLLTHHGHFVKELLRYEQFLNSPGFVLHLKKEASTARQSNLTAMRSTETFFMETGSNIVSQADEGITVYNDNDFPFFPTKGGDTYRDHMLTTLKVVENWLFAQGFYKKKYLKIPDTISLVPLVIESRKQEPSSVQSGSVMIEPPHLHQLMTNLIGKKLSKGLITTMPASESLNDVSLHFYSIYENILQYLLKEEAHFPHVNAEYLLNYEQYLVIHRYMLHKMQYEERLEKDQFIAISTQVYLDVILQIIKILILNRIRMFPLVDNVLARKSIIMARHDDLIDSIFTKEEFILLFWLQHHFDKQRTKLWKSERVGVHIIEVVSKDIRCFDNVLCDSLVLAAVTASYCPYVSEGLKNMYIQPGTYEELYHNACILIETWQSLNLSYLIEPVHIVNPNHVNMMLLVLYLFEVLPSLSPCQTIYLKANLTEESRCSVNIYNKNDFTITYSIFFYNNDIKAFRVTSDTFKIPAWKAASLKIIYQALKFQKIEAVLLLSGERPGAKYSKSLAFQLVGIPNILVSEKGKTTIIPIAVDQYKVFRKEIQILSPYNFSDEYEIYYNVGNIKKNEQMNRWKDYLESLVPKRLFIKDHTFAIENPEDGYLMEAIVCCRMPMTTIYNLFMIGSKGDFLVRLQIICRLSKKSFEIIEVNVPRGAENQECVCKNPDEIYPICPKTLRLQIPCKNNLFWKATKDIFKACVTNMNIETSFWKKYLATRIGSNVLNVIIFNDRLSTSNFEYEEMAKKFVEFAIKLGVNPVFKTLKTIKIDDLCADTFVEIPIHINDNFNLHEEVFMRLESVKGVEKRLYKIVFHQL